MAVSAPITSGSGTTLVARSKVLAALTEGLRARTGPLRPGAACGRWPLSRPVHSLGDDQVVHRQPVEHHACVDLAGLPVLVIGGLATSPHILGPLQDWLHRLGCRPLLTPSQYGIACGQRAAIAVEEALARHVDTTGEQAVIIAHSRGGQFARPVAVRHPELLRGLITLGSPLNRLLGVHRVVLVKVLGLGVGGSRDQLTHAYPHRPPSRRPAGGPTNTPEQASRKIKSAPPEMLPTMFRRHRGHS